MEMTTLEELEKLLKAGTPGPWKIERGKRCIQGPDTGEGDALVITSVMGGSTQWSASPYQEYCTAGMHEGDANAALIVAAINALPGLIESAKRVERLEAALKFYADPSRWPNMPNPENPHYDMEMDAGTRARAVLKGT